MRQLKIVSHVHMRESTGRMSRAMGRSCSRTVFRSSFDVATFLASPCHEYACLREQRKRAVEQLYEGGKRGAARSHLAKSTLRRLSVRTRMRSSAKGS